jgi:Zn-dependent protease
MLGVAEISSLFLAVLICWIFSVCVHEFAHAVVAYLGGDRSVVERGYLHFNIFAFVNPVTSLLMPALFLFMGGLPLPGGAVYIDEHSLRSPVWRSLVAAAGPASNFVLFLILAALVHPSTGLVDLTSFKQPTWVMLLGAMTVLELFSVLFNLIPVPPLDGYGIIEPYLPPDVREKARSMGWVGLFVLFFAFFQFPGLMARFQDLIDAIMRLFGLPFESTWRFYNVALFGSSQ